MNNTYWYNLPERLIAQAPVNPRDSSKLLIYNTQTNEIKITNFSHLATSLAPFTTLILNDAKVVPARVTLSKGTGGKIVVFFLLHEWIRAPSGLIPCFLDRKARVGDRIYFPDKSFVTVQNQRDAIFFVSWGGTVHNLLKILDLYGTMPIPPYIKHSPLTRDELLEKYQSIFAKKIGSSAAPTASLHFTPALITSLEDRGIQMLPTTLHVGLGTFAPLTNNNLVNNTLHAEWYEISEYAAKKIKNIKENDRTILAVGTTVVRTLESYMRQGVLGKEFSGTTDLFIRPGHTFKLVDRMITNFHLPNSSLMMLVDAFLAHKKAPKRILELYEYAIQNEFRFYSFGDAMMIL